MWAWIWLACGGDKLETEVPTSSAETGTIALSTATTADSAPEVAYFDAQWVYVSAQFGFDVSTQQISTLEYANGSFEFPYIQIVMATDAWSGDYAEIEEHCTILLVLESSVVADWVTDDPRLVWGVDWDPGDVPLSTCGGPGYELDPLEWGVNIAEQFVDGGGWGVAVGELTPGLAKDLEPTFGADLERVVGGTFRISDMLPGDPIETVYGFAYALDDDGVVVDEDEDGQVDPVLPGELHDGTRLLRSAWIQLYTTTYWGN